MLQIKVEPEDHARWKALAHDQRLSLSEYVRRALDAYGSPGESRPPEQIPEFVELARKAKTKGGVCEHRNPSGAWCKRCGGIVS